MSEFDLTLVCHYGDKPAPLAALLQRLVRLLAERWGAAFEPYSLGQMHATLIGLETELVDNRRVNRWFWKHRGERRVPDADRLAELLETTPRLPLRVRFGGFRADSDYLFTSRGQHPHQRSFQCQGDQVVVMGWPEASGAFPGTLAELRGDFEAANVLHKYHADRERDRDNDLFIVLGNLNRSPGPDVGRVEVEARELLVNTPTWVEIDREALALIAYTDPRLPAGECRCWPAESELLRSVMQASGRISP